MKVVRKWTVEKKQLKKWEKGRMVVMVDGGMGRASPFLRGWAAAAMSGEWQPGTMPARHKGRRAGALKTTVTRGNQGVFSVVACKICCHQDTSYSGYSGVKPKVPKANLGGATAALPHLKLCHV